MKAHLNRQSNLGIQYISELSRIFRVNDWDKSPGYQNILDKFCFLLEVLDDEKRDFIIELTERFLVLI